ncbi:MAG: SdpI family protein [Rhodanobacter sp.]
MKFHRNQLVSVVFITVAAVVAVWLYPRLPAVVPTHWDMNGHINGYMPRFWAAAMPALMIFGLAVLAMLLPAISPRRFEIAPFAQAYGIVMLATQGLMLVVGLSTLLSGAGYAVPIPTIVMLSVGVLFMVMGNYMGKLRKNFFVGIRTPWTLASDAVWERTHRFGGWLFMLAGLVVVIAALVGAPPRLLVVVLLAVTVISCGYSFLIYRRLEGRR